MKRRDFLQKCMGTGLLLGAGSSLWTSCAPAMAGPTTGHDLVSAGGALRWGQLNPSLLVDQCRNAAAQLNPTLNAILEINPELDTLAKNASGEGPLAGLPILLKDNIATGDQMTTTAGSAALEGARCQQDAEVVSRLRQAGAIVFGKSNMSEWANFRSSKSSSGWSARGGQCRNPYALDRSPCGSSSGSAVAVSTGIVPVALGTETVGSIVCPSGMCGIVGLKPTYGLVSGSGVIPGAASFDTVGPLAQTVADVALLLSVIAAKLVQPDLRCGALRGRRLGVDRRSFGVDTRVDSLIEGQLEVLRHLGAEVVDLTDVPRWSDMGQDLTLVLGYELKDGLNRYFASPFYKGPIRTLADIIAFNIANPEREGMENFGQDLLLAANSMGPLTDPAYRQAMARVRKAADLPAVLCKHRLDAVVGPTNGPAWMIDPVNGDHFLVGNAAAAAVSGCPSMTVPAGFVLGLPIGLTFTAPAWNDQKLLEMAFDYEQETRHRQAPTLRKSVGAAAGTATVTPATSPWR